MNYFFLCLSIFIPINVMAQNLRTIHMDQTKIFQIRTAPGYSTMLSFPSRVLQVILGDSNSFKVEYLPSDSQNLTIKPLAFGVRSNLFILTAFGKTSLQLVTTEHQSSDYIVKFAYPLEKKVARYKPALKFREIILSKSGIRLTVKKIATSTEGNLVAFSIHNSSSKKIRSVTAPNSDKFYFDSINGIAISKTLPVIIKIHLPKKIITFKVPNA